MIVRFCPKPTASLESSNKVRIGYWTKSEFRMSQTPSQLRLALLLGECSEPELDVLSSGGASGMATCVVVALVTGLRWGSLVTGLKWGVSGNRSLGGGLW